MISNFGFLLPQKLAGSAHPGYGANLRENIAWLYEKGIRNILTLSGESLPEALLRECGIGLMHLPVVDFTPPSPEQIQQGVEFLRAAIVDRNEAALVHCGSGYGRTGTMLACYLVSQGESAEAAIEMVRQKRPGSI